MRDVFDTLGAHVDLHRQKPSAATTRIGSKILMSASVLNPRSIRIEVGQNCGRASYDRQFALAPSPSRYAGPWREAGGDVTRQKGAATLRFLRLFGLLGQVINITNGGANPNPNVARVYR